MDKKRKAVIVYSSPACTTRHVAEIIMSALADGKCDTMMFDLGKPEDCKSLESVQNSFAAGDCLWIGSPVYTYHALPGIMGFITGLPRDKGAFAVPFVTWGAVSSGLALSEMASQLNGKGYSVAGAAKIAAVHSMMWQVKNPLGHDRPDSVDDALISDLVKKVYASINSGEFEVYPVENLNYQPESVQAGMHEMNIGKAKQIFPKIEADRNLCSQCGECEKACPVQAIRCSPYPHIKDVCILCFNCVRLCEEKAFNIDLSQYEGMLLNMAVENNEHPLSKIFV